MPQKSLFLSTPQIQEKETPTSKISGLVVFSLSNFENLNTGCTHPAIVWEIISGVGTKSTHRGTTAQGGDHDVAHLREVRLDVKWEVVVMMVIIKRRVVRVVG